jgi:hypothetical protein
MLILFSFVLALSLSQLWQKIHENQQAREVACELREELVSNRSGRNRVALSFAAFKEY